MIRFLSPILYLVLLLLLFSCHNREVDVSKLSLIGNNSSSYNPLFLGKKTNYALLYSNNYKTEQGSCIVKVDSKENIKGKEYFKIVYTYSGMPGMESSTFYSRLSDEGVFTIEGKDPKLIEQLEVKFPLEIGTTWQSISTNGILECMISSIETLNLIDKEFKNCYKITFTRKEGGTGYYYLAKGIGLVKFVMNIGYDTFEMTITK